MSWGSFIFGWCAGWAFLVAAALAIGCWLNRITSKPHKRGDHCSVPGCGQEAGHWSKTKEQGAPP